MKLTSEWAVLRQSLPLLRELEPPTSSSGSVSATSKVVHWARAFQTGILYGAAMFVIHTIRGFGALSPTGSPFRALPYPMDARISMLAHTPCVRNHTSVRPQTSGSGRGRRMAIRSRGDRGSTLVRSTTRVINLDRPPHHVVTMSTLVCAEVEPDRGYGAGFDAFRRTNNRGRR